MKSLVASEMKNVFSRKRTYVFLAIEIIAFIFLCVAMPVGDTAIKGFNFNNYMINESFCNLFIIIFSIVFTADIFLDKSKRKSFFSSTYKCDPRGEILISKFITIAIMVVVQFVIIIVPTLIVWAIFHRIPTNNPMGAFYGFFNQSLLPIIISVAITFFLVMLIKSKIFAIAIPVILIFVGNILSYTEPIKSIRKYYIYSYIEYPITKTNVSITFILIISCIYLVILFGIPTVKYMHNSKVR